MAGTKPLRSKALVSALHRKFAAQESGPSKVRRALAKELGFSAIQLYNWQRRDQRVGAAQVANLVAKAQKQAQRNSIQPIIEFFDFIATNEQIDESGNPLKKYKKFQLFRSANRYEEGVRRELENNRGIYIFYDNRGRALYVGKASQQSLWKEIHAALNRKRDVQKIKRVKHPERGVQFRTSDEKKRQIQPWKMQLHELAQYVSAYRVPQPVIGVFEAMLVRSFPNDLLNVKMETFAPAKRKKKRRQRRRRA